jgi:hypothetical protein
VDSVREEKRVGDIILDLILKIGHRELLVEVFVTHRVDNRKIEKIRKIGMSAIEIDLSASPRHMPMEALSELIVNGVDNKKWLNNERIRKERQKLMEKAVHKEIIPIGEWDLQVKECPKKMRTFNGKGIRNASYLNDCLGCEYRLEIEPSNSKEVTHVYCIGHIQGPFSTRGTDT